MRAFRYIACFVLPLVIFLIPSSLVRAEPQWPHVEQEIIVRYKAGFSPEELIQKVAARKKKGEVFVIGPIRVWMENMKLALSKNAIPEVHLSTIKSIENTIAVSGREVLFQEEGISNIYLVKYKSPENIERVVKMFQSIPEVEFAEPNYIYDELGI